jgi:hypothetical protein
MPADTAPDDYERTYMDADRALFRVRTSLSPPHAAFLGLVCLGLILASALSLAVYVKMASSGLLPYPFCLAGLAASVLSLLFSPAVLFCSLVSRVTVTRDAVHVQSGMHAGSYPIASILASRVLTLPGRGVLFPRVLGEFLVLRLARRRGIRSVFLRCARPDAVLRAIRDVQIGSGTTRATVLRTRVVLPPPEALEIRAADPPPLPTSRSPRAIAGARR